MNAPQLVRAAGTLARLCGLADRQAELVALEERVTLDDVLDLVDDIAQAVDRARPAPPPGQVGVREPRPRRIRQERILELAASGMHDPEIAAELGLSSGAVRGVRRRAGVAGKPKPRESTGWREMIADAHARGLTNAEISKLTGYTQRTVEQRLHQLGLRSNKSRLPPEPGDAFSDS